MKKAISIIALFLVLIFCATLLGGCVKQSNLYAMATIVQSVDVENDVVIVKDSSGNTWNFTGIGNWQVNDVCSCVMDSKGTPAQYDDTIISTHYDGQILGWIIK